MDRQPLHSICPLHAGFERQTARPARESFFQHVVDNGKKTFQQYGLLCENCGMPPWLAEIR